MPFAKGRNEMQASIDDTASALVLLTNEIESYYSQKISELSFQIEKIRKDNLNEAPEVLHCMESPNTNINWIYDEMHENTLEMLLCKVYSYVEKHMEALLKRIPLTGKKARKAYKGEGVSDIEKYYAVLKEKYNLQKQNVTDIWKDYEKFHELRKGIVHRYNYDRDTITANYILSNIEQAKALLNYIEDNTR